MSRRFSKIIPKSPSEVERFYLDVIDKLQNTTSSLADEEQKSSLPVLGMVRELDRKIESLSRDTRNIKASFELADRKDQEIRILRSQITRLEVRLNDLERRL